MCTLAMGEKCLTISKHIRGLINISFLFVV